MASPNVVVDAQCLLGETPLWHYGQQALYWVNIMAGEVHRYVPQTGEHRYWSQGFLCAGLAQTGRTDQLLVVSQEGLVVLDTTTGNWRRHREPLWSPEAMIRPNEAKVDPQGRLWVATTNLDESYLDGQLFRFDGDEAAVMVEQLCIPNTLAWSPDLRYFYFADSKLQTLNRYPYDPESGALGLAEPFFSVSGQQGTIDGSAMDEEGCLWTCLWGQGRVVRLDLRGQVLQDIPVPVLNPTSCCFGGPDMSTLYITSARKNLTSAQLADYPQSGAVLSLEAGVRGVAIPAFAGDIPPA